MKFLVTGATGFLGSHFARRLTKAGHHVRVLVSETRRTGKKEALQLLSELNTEFFYGDLRDETSLQGIADSVDYVVHCAAIARPSPVPDSRYLDVNEMGTRNLLEHCKHTDLSKVLVMSSITALGPCNSGNILCGESECRPNDLYGASKRAQEKIALSYMNDYQMPIVMLRPPTVFGPRDREFLRLIQMIKRQIFPIRCETKCINYVYVDNLIDASVLALEKATSGAIYLVDNDELCSLNEIIGQIARSIGVRIIPVYLPKSVMNATGYLLECAGKWFHFQPPFKHDTTKWMTEPIWACDITPMKELGYVPRVSVVQGIARTVEYCVETGMLK